MKINKKQLVLRPFRPGFMRIIPRFPSIVTKSQILFRIFSPITYFIRCIKNVFKKEQFSQKLIIQNRPKKLKMHSNIYYPMVIHEAPSEDHFASNCGDFYKAQRLRSKVKNKRSIHNYAKSSQSIIKEEQCVSCKEDCTPNMTCPLCRGLNSTLPTSSCKNCQKKGPLINFCMRFHGERPRIYLPQDNTYLKVEEPKNRKCNGKVPTVFTCPMCLSLQPSMGECGCKKCNKCRPLVKLSSLNKTPMMYTCPCHKCGHLRPKIKICELCRMKQNQLPRAKSYYAIIL